MAPYTGGILLSGGPWDGKVVAVFERTRLKVARHAPPQEGFYTPRGKAKARQMPVWLWQGWHDVEVADGEG